MSPCLLSLPVLDPAHAHARVTEVENIHSVLQVSQESFSFSYNTILSWSECVSCQHCGVLALKIKLVSDFTSRNGFIQE